MKRVKACTTEEETSDAAHTDNAMSCDEMQEEIDRYNRDREESAQVSQLTKAFHNCSVDEGPGGVSIPEVPGGYAKQLRRTARMERKLVKGEARILEFDAKMTATDPPTFTPTVRLTDGKDTIDMTLAAVTVSKEEYMAIGACHYPGYDYIYRSKYSSANDERYRDMAIFAQHKALDCMTEFFTPYKCHCGSQFSVMKCFETSSCHRYHSMWKKWATLIVQWNDVANRIDDISAARFDLTNQQLTHLFEGQICLWGTVPFKTRYTEAKEIIKGQREPNISKLSNPQLVQLMSDWQQVKKQGYSTEEQQQRAAEFKNLLGADAESGMGMDI